MWGTAPAARRARARLRVAPAGIRGVRHASSGSSPREDIYRGPMRSPTWTPPTRARVRRVRDRLREVYGIPLMAPHGDPIAELVLTVLSQSTNDRNRDVAYLRLREWFATWEDVMRAPVGKVEEAIRPGGISKVKSVRIQAILQAIGAGTSELSLDWL